MRTLLIATAAVTTLALAAPAAAGTLQEVVDHGIILTVADMDIDVTYTKDGKFTALDGQVTGAYKIDGDKFCTSSNFDPTETCTVYPKDKKSGDTFELQSPQGAVKIKIK